MAIARGRRQAENENWEDFTRAQRAEDFVFQREQRDIKRQEQMWGQEAAAWLAPSISNRQLAADAGISPVDYEIQQREQTLANPEFQAKSPEVQKLILQQMQQRALLVAQTARDQGDITAANRVVQAYGQPRVLGAVQEAAYQGNVDEALTRAGFPPDENGMVAIGDVLVPKVIAAQQLIASGGVPGSVVTAAAQQQANAALLEQQKTTAQQVAEQQAVEQWTQARNAAQLAGLLPQFLQLNPDPRGAAAPTVGIPIPPTIAAPSGVTISDGSVGAPVMPSAMQQVVAAQQAVAPGLTAAQTAAVQAAGGVGTPTFSDVLQAQTPGAATQSAIRLMNPVASIITPAGAPPATAAQALQVNTQPQGIPRSFNEVMQLLTTSLPMQLLQAGQVVGGEQQAIVSEADALAAVADLQRQLAEAQARARTRSATPGLDRFSVSTAETRLQEAQRILQAARAKGAN